ncbi:ribulokinase [Albibacterium indicum]|uniref:ribulokinase n=1 Tax=Albibacterium indicum TaxID=2292082 RepID=UPI000E50134A|nr:ribulokinase [Pedobacter indicus]
MKDKNYCIGVDYGTDSVRTILVDAHNGTELASSVFYYPRWKEGLFCDPASNRFRQHPADYVEGLEYTIKECLSQVGAEVRKNVRAISTGTTGSTPVAVDEKGVPLALSPAFAANPNAMFFLWKDHTSIQEAADINQAAANHSINYLQYVGGIYSSEWFWAKLLNVLRNDAEVGEACYSWVEHCDWVPFLLTGGNKVEDMKRSVCAAGHKAMWAEEFGGLPPDEFWTSVDPLLSGFRERLSGKTYTTDQSAGTLSKEWADRLGLSTEVQVGVGAIDAHVAAVGGQIEPYYLSKVMGTSTCDMLVVPQGEMGENPVRGICGQVNGSIIPGMTGLEAGQSAFGDVYAWFGDLLVWPMVNILKQSELIDPETADKLLSETKDRLLYQLSLEAEQIQLTEDMELSIDWLNGRRTPDANQLLKGAISGLTLGTDAPKIFRSLVEATCFGAKMIVERFLEEGVPVKGLIGVGGIAQKSSFVMQMLADIMNMPIRVHSSEQTSALGAAMFAATVGGVYERVEDAMAAMGKGFNREYLPVPERTAIYNIRYQQYKSLGLCLDS